MRRLGLLLALLSSWAWAGFGIGGGQTCPNGFIGGGQTPCTPAGSQFPAYEIAPADGGGLGTQCACAAINTAQGTTVVTTRPSAANCASNDGQTLTLCPINTPRVSTGLVDITTPMGIWAESQRTNQVIQNRNLADVAWVSTGSTCTQTATGLDGVTNSASTCTASLASGTTLQVVTFSFSTIGVSLYVKRRTGTGNVAVTKDGTTFVDVTSSLSPSLWKRVTPYDTPGCMASTTPSGGNCIVTPSFAISAVTTVTVGIQITTPGDAVDIDFVQVEQSNPAGDVTSPIATTSAPVMRNADIVDARTTSLSLPVSFCASATSIVTTNNSTPAYHGVPGDGTPGVVIGSASYCASFAATALTTAVSPNSYASGLSVTGRILRYTTYYDGAKLNLCVNGTCAAGQAGVWTAPSWQRYRIGAYDTTSDNINGVQREIQIDASATKCRRTL